MALPANVDVCTVTGVFVYADGSIPVGTVEFTPTPCRLADTGAAPPTSILSAPIVATLDDDGAIDVEVPATDDPDLNPVDWTYRVRVRLNGTGPGVAYSFDMAAPVGTVDLAAVTPVESSDGSAIVVGPPGQGVPIGGVTGEVLAKASGGDYDTRWAPAPQPLDADLTAIAALNPSSNSILQRKVGTWVASTPTEYKADLNLSKTDVGLGNVNNTSDAAKPVSIATQTALNLKANKLIEDPAGSGLYTLGG